MSTRFYLKFDVFLFLFARRFVTIQRKQLLKFSNKSIQTVKTMKQKNGANVSIIRGSWEVRYLTLLRVFTRFTEGKATILLFFKKKKTKELTKRYTFS